MVSSKVFRRLKSLTLISMTILLASSLVGSFLKSEYVIDKGKYSLLTWCEYFLPGSALIGIIVEAVSLYGSLKNQYGRVYRLVDYGMHKLISILLLTSGVLYLTATAKLYKNFGCGEENKCLSVAWKGFAGGFALFVGSLCFITGAVVNGERPDAQADPIVGRHDEETAIEVLDSEQELEFRTVVVKDKLGLVMGELMNPVDTSPDVPFTLTGLKDLNVAHMSVGKHHLLILLESGELLSVGDNSQGQLGHPANSRGIPEKVLDLDNRKITKISARGWHNLAIAEDGCLLSWGGNRFGQTGHETSEMVPLPRVVRLKAVKDCKPVQVATGESHSMVLMEGGEVLIAGLMHHVRSTVGNVPVHSDKFILLAELYGAPINYIAAGASTSFAVNLAGRVYAWGNNSKHALGVEGEDANTPVKEVKALKNLEIASIEGGESHTCFLTVDGSLYTVGDGSVGQLGHGSTASMHLPRKVLEFGHPVIQVACGLKHTICISNGKVYGFGSNTKGQLLRGGTEQVYCLPTLLSSVLNESRNLYAGSQLSIYLPSIPQTDHRVVSRRLYCMNEADITDIVRATMESSAELIIYCLRVRSMFGSKGTWTGSFLIDCKTPCSTKNHGVNIELANAVFAKLAEINSPYLKEIVNQLIEQELTLPADHALKTLEMLRWYLLVPLLPNFYNETYRMSASDEALGFNEFPLIYAIVMLKLTKDQRNTVLRWIYEGPIEILIRFISTLKRTIVRINNCESFERAKKIVNRSKILLILKGLYDFNITGNRLSYHTFAIPNLSDTELAEDFILWRVKGYPAYDDERYMGYFYCQCPFILDLPAKSKLLQFDNNCQMRSIIEREVEVGGDILEDVLNNPDTMDNLLNTLPLYLRLNVSRDRIIFDVTEQLINTSTIHVKKPLRVSFDSEEAEDYGGVKKELFLLYFRQIVEEPYKVFRAYESNMVWFREDGDLGRTYVAGMMCGLAIYNSAVITAPFPPALFKKLRGEKCDISDLKELDPTMARNFECILEATDSEGLDGLTFTVVRKSDLTEVPLIEDGGNVSVTTENRIAYVDLYIDYIFNTSAEEQFYEFKRGFDVICESPVLSFFQPAELQAMAIGNEDYDWGQLENICKYHGAYANPENPVRIWFWETFYDLTLAEKKMFLLFLTGCDRAPVGGLGSLKMRIQPGPMSDEHFPVAHTCFNTLDIPVYTTKSVLAMKLRQAIQHNEGFGLV